ncbi:hypothetical protein DRQ36_06395 [bacterium]|nr:MAG: hypothetical protein DRQ36_06395 [bacterium]
MNEIIAKREKHDEKKNHNNRRNTMKNHSIGYFPIHVETNDDGFLARCHDLEGAFAEGDTIQEAIFNCIDVIQMIIEYRKERGETIPEKVAEIPKKYGVTLAFPVEV